MMYILKHFLSIFKSERPLHIKGFNFGIDLSVSYLFFKLLIINFMM